MGKKVKKEVEPPSKDVFDPLCIESKKTGTVVLMLKSDEEEVLTKACEAVYRFADKCDENKLMLLELGALEPILKLINHEDRVVKRFAVMSFGVMAGNSEVRRFLRKTNGIEEAIRLLGDEDDVCNEFASLFLANMSSEFISKDCIYKNDGLEPLINLLESPDPDVQKNSLQAVCNLSQDFEVQSSIRELGGIQPLLEFLKSEYAVIQELALHTLISITRNAEARTMLSDNEGLEQLVNFLSHKEYEELHVHAVQILANCLEDTTCLEEFRNCGGMERLLTFVVESATPEVQAHAMKAIAWSAKSVQNCKILHEQEVEKTLITLTGSENDAVKIASCQAISVLAENLSARDMFGKCEGISPLINLLQNESKEIKEASTLALANLTVSHNNNCRETLALGGAEQLISLISCREEPIAANSLSCLINMSHDESIRTEIQKHGIISALTVPLKSDSAKIQSKAAQAVASFVTDSDARAELLKYGGMEPLIRQLRSGDAQLCRDASWVIFSICVDQQTAVTLSNLGAIEILQQINASQQRRNNFSLVAFVKLLDANLPAKYSFTGKLEEHNIISDGFYDCGLLQQDSKFKSIQEIAVEEVNQRRAVIAVNYKLIEPVRSVQDEASDKRVSSKASMTRRKKKEKDAQFKDAEKLQAEKNDNLYRPPMDSVLKSYIDDVTKFIQPMSTTAEQIVALAQYVAEKMGGEVEKSKMMDYTWKLHIAELKFQLKSNIIPIGKIQRGVFYHRALLFKVLADQIAVPCSLIQAEYGRAWNEVKLSFNDKGNNFPPLRYLVDLMHNAGRLIRSDSPDAVKYRSL